MLGTRGKSLATKNAAGDGRFNWASMHTALLWAGMGVLLMAGWHFVNALWRVEGASTAGRSGLAWYSSLPLAVAGCGL